MITWLFNNTYKQLIYKNIAALAKLGQSNGLDEIQKTGFMARRLL